MRILRRDAARPGRWPRSRSLNPLMVRSLRSRRLEPRGLPEARSPDRLVLRDGYPYRACSTWASKTVEVGQARLRWPPQDEAPDAWVTHDNHGEVSIQKRNYRQKYLISVCGSSPKCFAPLAKTDLRDR